MIRRYLDTVNNLDPNFGHEGLNRVLIYHVLSSIDSVSS
jgi:hypothetical protein